MLLPSSSQDEAKGYFSDNAQQVFQLGKLSIKCCTSERHFPGPQSKYILLLLTWASDCNIQPKKLLKYKLQGVVANEYTICKPYLLQSPLEEL